MRPFFVTPLKTSSAYRASKERVINNFLRDLPSDIHVLDLGCGDGRYKVVFRGFYIGLDIERVFMDGCFVVGDGRKLPFRNDSFEFVFCNEVLEYVKDDHLIVNETHRVLKTGGIALFSVPTLYYWDLSSRIRVRRISLGYRGYTLRILERLFIDHTGFKVLRVIKCAGIFCHLWMKINYVVLRFVKMLCFSSSRRGRGEALKGEAIGKVRKIDFTLLVLRSFSLRFVVELDFLMPFRFMSGRYVVWVKK